MGFDLGDLTKIPSDEQRWRDLLSRLEAEFADVDDPAVHSRDDEAPGMLLMIERCVDSGHYDLAARIMADLCGNKAQRLGALKLTELRRREVRQWHDRAKPAWKELRNRHSRARCASLIKDRLGDSVPSERQIMRAIKEWERDVE
jgi:hypothetical protein